MYTRALRLAALSTWPRYDCLALYNLVQALPLLAIAIVFVRAMDARKLTEGEGRVLELVPGYMLGVFGVVLPLAPELLVNTMAPIRLLATAIAAK